jgi:hypothetical protein
MCKMPPHLASKYPVETKYARGNSHIKRGATRVMQQLMVTYGNGDLFSRLLFDNLKELHVDATENYYSYCESYEQAHPNDDKFEPGEYPEVYGEWITKFPPLGGTIRKLYDDRCNSNWNHYKMANGNRQKRELMSETCEKMFVYDRTHTVSRQFRCGKNNNKHCTHLFVSCRCARTIGTRKSLAWANAKWPVSPPRMRKL